MQKYNDILGLPVICARDGYRVGIIKDLIFCSNVKKVVAFLLERHGCQVSKRGVLLKDVLNLGNDALIINDISSIIKLKSLKSSEECIIKDGIIGRRVYCRQGEELGFVKDVVFDYKTGRIDGVETSDGLFQDLLTGRNIVPLLGRVEFGDESILVDKEALEETISTGKGIVNILKE